jgi:hypothetical protein
MTPQFSNGVSRFPIGESLDHEQINGSIRHLAGSKGLVLELLPNEQRQAASAAATFSARYRRGRIT